jgi:hypothetical protein
LKEVSVKKVTFVLLLIYQPRPLFPRAMKFFALLFLLPLFGLSGCGDEESGNAVIFSITTTPESARSGTGMSSDHTNSASSTIATDQERSGESPRPSGITSTEQGNSSQVAQSQSSALIASASGTTSAESAGESATGESATPEIVSTMASAESGGGQSASDMTTSPEQTDEVSQFSAEFPRDDDQDGWDDPYDNCPALPNSDQLDTDNDGRGDPCDDDDRDGIVDISDNCFMVANPDQSDRDQDGIGDACAELRANERALQRIFNTPLQYPLRLVLIGDIQPPDGAAYFRALRQYMLEMEPQPAFVIVLGDFVGYGSPDEYKKYIANLADFPIPVLSVIGNHEMGRADGYKNYLELMGPADFRFDYGPHRFVAMNDAIMREKEYGLLPAQIDWLLQNLDDNSGRVSDRFVFMHVPPKIPLGVYSIYDGHFFDGINDFLAGSDLMRLLEMYHTTLAAFGHWHIYGNYSTGSTRYLVTGGGAGNLDLYGGYQKHPWQDAVLVHFVTIDIPDERGNHYQGNIYEYGSGATPLPEFAFDQARGTKSPHPLSLPFQELFDDPRLPDWEERVYYGPGNDDPSDWQIESGRLYQRGNFYSQTLAPALEGAYIRTWDTSWTDVEMSVEVNSPDNDAYGVMFRYQDDQNYYRFSMDQERAYRRLVRKKDGIFTTMYEDSKSYTADTTYNIKISAIGPDITIWINNVYWTTQTDPDPLLLGGIGLYVYGSLDTWFDNVFVLAED